MSTRYERFLTLVIFFGTSVLVVLLVAIPVFLICMLK
jgi:hypothetical protein